MLSDDHAEKLLSDGNENAAEMKSDLYYDTLQYIKTPKTPTRKSGVGHTSKKAVLSSLKTTPRNKKKIDMMTFEDYFARKELVKKPYN
jgi:hypothetical protein